MKAPAINHGSKLSHEHQAHKIINVHIPTTSITKLHTYQFSIVKRIEHLFATSQNLSMCSSMHKLWVFVALRANYEGLYTIHKFWMSIVLRTNCECLEHPFVAPQNLSLDNIVDCEHLKFVMPKHPQFEHLWFVFNYVFNLQHKASSIWEEDLHNEHFNVYRDQFMSIGNSVAKCWFRTKGNQTILARCRRNGNWE